MKRGAAAAKAGSHISINKVGCMGKYVSVCHSCFSILLLLWLFMPGRVADGTLHYITNRCHPATPTFPTPAASPVWHSCPATMACLHTHCSDPYLGTRVAQRCFDYCHTCCAAWLLYHGDNCATLCPVPTDEPFNYGMAVYCGELCAATNSQPLPNILRQRLTGDRAVILGEHSCNLP